MLYNDGQVARSAVSSDDSAVGRALFNEAY